LRLLWWTLAWIVLAATVTGLMSWHSSHVDFVLWRELLRVAGGTFFFIALVAGGILTTEAAYRTKRRFFYREEWSFICALVTVSLFGLSLLLP
jgi:hypothetical protein